MRLATIHTPNSPDGRPCIVSPCGTRLLSIPADISPSLLYIVEHWESVRDQLQALYHAAARCPTEFTIDYDPKTIAAPLPRTWSFLDGSAFLSHVQRARQARGAELPHDLHVRPLMYQGVSEGFLGPQEPIVVLDPDFGYDYEGEFCVVTSHVVQGSNPEQCLSAIVLVLLMNDITLRSIVPIEAATGLGLVQSKPASSFAPFAVTVDHLGPAWHGGRVALELLASRNGVQQGRPNGSGMHFHFGELIAHAARTRSLPAGTIIGSGTVSSADEEAGTCCIAEQRAKEQLSIGQPVTPFLSVGDIIELDCLQDSQSVFGAIRQQCIAGN